MAISFLARWTCSRDFPLIHRTVRLRMKALGLKKPDDYERLLKTHPAALDELIEAVVVTETWFFRDRAPFAAFTDLALPWFPKNSAGTLRVLSVPCSSGEEPYSLAMALLDALVPPHQFLIDCVDISAQALARARHAVYGRNSFRGNDLAFRARHFRQTKDGYVLNPAVRERVRFHRENILGEEFQTEGAPYHFVFCRNPLIYFDRATQVRALEKLHRLLAPDGVLFVGPAELPLVSGNGFVSANLPMAFACFKSTAPAAASAKTSPHDRTAVQSLTVTSTAHPATEKPVVAGVLRQPGVHASAKPPSDLERGHRRRAGLRVGEHPE